MHVLIVAVSSATAPSGICRHAANLASNLAAGANISRVTMLVGKWQESYFNHAFGLVKKDIKIVPVNIRPNAVVRNMWYMTGLPKVAAAYQADVVHLSFPVPILRRYFHCPVVASIHDLYPYDVPANFGRGRAFVNRFFLRQCLRESDFVVCVSDFTLSRLRSLFGRLVSGKAARVYPSIALESGYMKEPALSGVRNQNFILTVAQHRKNKNLSLLLSAFADLQRRHGRSDLKLVVVGGNGPETPRLERLARRLCVHRSVVFAKVLNDDELCWLYRHCALFVAPSLVEGFGHPVCEALRCGCRTLCSRIPAFQEVVGAECKFFDLECEWPAGTLADAMTHTMAEPAPKTSDWNRFSSQQAAAQHLALYRALTSSAVMVPGSAMQSHIRNESEQQDRFAS